MSAAKPAVYSHASLRRVGASPLAFDVGLRPVVALDHFLVPAATGVFPGDAGLVAGRTLLTGGAQGGFAGVVVAAEGLRIDAVYPIGPATVVLDNLIGDLGHARLRN